MRISEPNNKLPLGQHAAVPTSQSHCVPAALCLYPLFHSDLPMDMKIRGYRRDQHSADHG